MNRSYIRIPPEDPVEKTAINVTEKKKISQESTIICRLCPIEYLSSKRAASNSNTIVWL